MNAPVLALKNASFGYGPRPVFAGVDLAIEAGEILTVLGTNGCGKSTLLRCLGGLLQLDTGSARLEGEDLAKFDPAARARAIGFLFQDHAPSLPFSVRELVQLGRAPHVGWLGTATARDGEAVEAALEEVGIVHLAQRAYTTLSGGERQLALLARTLAQEPRVILMDEPTAHLDLRNQVRCLRSVRSLAGRGVAVVVTTHDPNHAFALGGRALLLKTGAAPLEGRVPEVLDAASLSATYGIGIGVHRVPRVGGAGEVTLSSPW